MDEALARARLAEQGVDARANLEAAVALFQQAGAIFGEGPHLATCLMNEGTARMMLAQLGVDARANLEAAVALYQQARAILGSGPDFAGCLMNEGDRCRRTGWSTIRA